MPVGVVHLRVGTISADAIARARRMRPSRIT